MSQFTASPATGSGGATCDGIIEAIELSPVGDGWSQVRDDTTGISSQGGGIRLLVEVTTSSASKFNVLGRTFLTLDLSSLTGITIVSGSLTVTGFSKTNNFVETPSMYLVESSPASAGTLVGDDYDNVGSVSFGNITYAGFSTSGANVITLNAAGLAYILTVAGSIAKLAFRHSWDLDNTPPTVGANKTFNIQFHSSDTGTDPVLTIDYIPAITFSFSGANANKLMGADTTLEYSLNGGGTYSACTANIDLTSVVSSIIDQFGIKIRIVSLPGTVSTITIGKAPSAPSIVFPRFGSNKNKLLGSTSLMEYSTNGGSTYTTCSTDTDLSAVNLEDIAAILVRVKATGTTPSGRTTSIGLDPVMTKLTVPQLVNLVKIHHAPMFEVNS